MWFKSIFNRSCLCYNSSINTWCCIFTPLCMLPSGMNRCRAAICHGRVSFRVKTSVVKVPAPKWKNKWYHVWKLLVLSIKLKNTVLGGKRRNVKLQAINRQDDKGHVWHLARPCQWQTLTTDGVRDLTEVDQKMVNLMVWCEFVMYCSMQLLAVPTVHCAKALQLQVYQLHLQHAEKNT